MCLSDRDDRVGDDRLGAELRRLPVPEHRTRFFDSLEAGLRRGEERPAGRRPWLRLAWVPIPVAAVVLLVLWAFAGPLGIDLLRPQAASAAEIVGKVTAAVSDANALSGTIVIAYPHPVGEPALPNTVGSGKDARDETKWSFVSTADGDFRLRALVVAGDQVGHADDLAYDHETGVQRGYWLDQEAGVANASELTGLAAGPPDPGPADYVLDRQLGGVVRALRESDDVEVTEDAYVGRPVWKLSLDVQPNRLSTSSGDHLVVLVDRETGFPVKAVETKAGEFVQELRLEELKIDPALPVDAFTVVFPEGAEVYRNDLGFRSLGAEMDPAHLVPKALESVGYRPILPSDVPEGLVLADVRVAKQGQPTGKEGSNPAAGGVISAVYRRGFDRLIVSTRLRGPDPSAWSDPLASGEGFVDSPESITLGSGAFAGERAELLIDARSVPHIWAMSDDLVMTVSGDLTRDELLAVADSLEPLR